MSKQAENAAAAAKGIAFVGPMVTLLFAGLCHQINWDLQPQGYLLLAACAGLGFLLGLIPRKAHLWEVAAATPDATLKQTVETLRVIVAIVLVVVPFGVLCTNNAWMAKVPEQFNDSAATFTKDADGDDATAQVLYISNQSHLPMTVAAPPATTAPAPAKVKAVIYIGRLAEPARAAASLDAGLGSTAPASVVNAPAGQEGVKLYVVDASWAVGQLAEQYVLKPVFIAGFFAWLMAAMFVFAIFLIENIGDMTRGPNLARAAA